jgi:branched-chain amino acid aminotransferase
MAEHANCSYGNPDEFYYGISRKQILNTCKHQQLCSDSARVRITVYRNDGGYYLPETNKCFFLIQASKSLGK